MGACWKHLAPVYLFDTNRAALRHATPSAMLGRRCERVQMGWVPMSSDRLNVFVSYSRKDSVWLERVKVHLEPLAKDGQLDLWDDTQIKTGQRWREEIKAALARADVAILLISADFFASVFIAKDELPPLLEAARSERGLVIAGVHINYSRFDRDRVLSEYQTVNTPNRPIEGLSKADQEKVFDDLARSIEDLLVPADPR